MPIVQIQMLEGRSKEMKLEIIREVTKTLSKITDTPPERVRIIIQDIPYENWGLGGESMEQVRRK